MFFFHPNGKEVFPALATDPRSGKRRVADGVNVLDLKQAVAWTGKSEAALKAAWDVVFGGLLREEKIDGSPVDGAAETPTPEAQAIAALPEDEQLEMLHQLVYPQLSNEQFAFFVTTCRKHRFSPWCRHLWPKLIDGNGKATFELVTTISGIRLLSDRTGRIAHVGHAHFSGPDGVFKEVWVMSDGHPAAAKVEITLVGESKPRAAIAYWEEYAPKFVTDTGDIGLPDYWLNMPRHALGKCAEALARRLACPDDLSGIYVAEEMHRTEMKPDRKQRPALPNTPPGSPYGVQTILNMGSDGDRVTPENTDYLDSEEEFDSVLSDSGYPAGGKREDLLKAYRQQWPAVFRTDRNKFFAMVVKDIRRKRGN